MSLNPDTVDITVGDTTYTLVPNLEAATAVSLNLNGPLAALEGLKGMNILTVTGIIAAGASLPRKEAADLSKKIFESGDMAEISAQCVDFCILLMNGGKREEKKEAAGKKSEATKS